jgi:hypothetical protein
MDVRLNTANPSTVYLFNYNRGEIIEYRRDIIEPKLRPLNDDESKTEKTLKSAFSEVRSDFTPRGGQIAAIPEKGKPKPAPKKRPVEEQDEELDSLIGDDIDDDADWGDD